MKKFLGLVLLMLIMGANVVFADSYYVSPSGNDKNAGTIKKPFKTIGKALDTINKGDTVYIRGGIYNEQLNVKTSGTEKSPICIRNYENESVVVDGKNKDTKNEYGNIALLSAINKSYVEVRGIEFRNLSTTTKHVVHGIAVLGYGDGVSIKNCKVHDIKNENNEGKANAHGISVYGYNSSKPMNNVLLDGNEVYNCKLGSSESIALNGNVTNFTVINNIVHDNDNIGIDFIGFEGAAGSSSKDRARNGVCRDNCVYNIASKNNPAYNGGSSAAGIYVDGGKDIIIERNNIKNCDVGVSIASEHKGKNAENIIVRNNLVTDCLSYAGIIFGGCNNENGVAVNVKIYNNTIYNCRTGVVIQNANSSTNEVKNNIIYNCKNSMYGEVGKNQVSNNLTKNPSFVDVSKNNYRLKENSIAIDKGVSVDCGEYDLDKNMRKYNGIVDMGCYEYVPSYTSINIDGVSKEWNNIKSIASCKNGNLKELKAYRDDKYLYICATGDKLNSYPNLHIYINSDNDTKTGFGEGGADYLVENGSLYKYAKKYGTSWDFESIGKVYDYKVTSNCIEYKLKLDSMKNIGKKLRLKLVVLNKNWNGVYQIPETGFSLFE